MGVNVSYNFPVIKTVFDTTRDHPQTLIYSNSIRNALLRHFPSHFFLKHYEEPVEFLKEFQQVLPVFKWSYWERDVHNISLFLLTLHRHNTLKFFHEMISRWLLPGTHLNISSFFSTQFSFPEISSDVYIICELVISLNSAQELSRVDQHLPIFESEVKLGLVSAYHANCILEIKGLSSDAKTSLIQERISWLLKKKPRHFDYDIFSQMQHVLITCKEEFKIERSFAHMARIICIFYLFHRQLRELTEQSRDQRFAFVKLARAHLQQPLRTKRVLAVFVGMNLLNDNELFEERHLIEVIKTLLPTVRLVEHSYLSSSAKEKRLHLLYLEIEKEGNRSFSSEEVKQLKGQLPDVLRNGVEKLKRPLFMPRNEEEVMRNIITLSHQLRYPKDLPQVIITFDEQTQDELFFTIIFLRILSGSELSVQELFQKTQTCLKYIPDRVKKVGTTRKKYVKEATVFGVMISALGFIRPDHSVDLFKARQEVLIQLQKIFGEVRDYNGGMIAKQHEQFLILKSLFPPMEKREDLLLENVFHSIFPIELRSLLDPLLIKIFFILLLELIEKKNEAVLCKREEKAAFCVVSYRNAHFKQEMVKRIAELHIPASQLITISLPVFEVFYFGCIFCQTDLDIQKKFTDIFEQTSSLLRRVY